MHNMEHFNKYSCILIEQDGDPVLLNFTRQMVGFPSDGQILTTSPKYILIAETKNES